MMLFYMFGYMLIFASLWGNFGHNKYALEEEPKFSSAETIWYLDLFAQGQLFCEIEIISMSISSARAWKYPLSQDSTLLQN